MVTGDSTSNRGETSLRWGERVINKRKRTVNYSKEKVAQIFLSNLVIKIIEFSNILL